VTDQRRAFGCLIEAVETVVLTAIIFFVLQTFVAQPFQVEQVSMRDTIEPQQYVLVDKLTPRFDGYHRGDIIVFNPPDNTELGAGKPYIKRIVGVGGDSVQIKKDGKVYVNGTQLEEPYLFTGPDGTPQPTQPHGDSAWTIPDGDLFVMGDHRQQSQDSRDFGPIAVSSVLGRAWLRYWPAAAFGVLPTDGHVELTAGSSAPPAKSAAPPARSAAPSAKSAASTAP
jgi:signal peptidase I